MTTPPDRLVAALTDRYTIERELGAGGMATVYLAHDVKHDRKVALKVLRPDLAAVIGAERFLAEIKTTANLQHPHILALHDSGEVDGTVFYVMPFVEGESLRDRLDRETQLPLNEAVRLASEVASALDYAHRHDVIHRDIKPENILLHEGRAMVADFGIALAASRSGDATRMTETGMSLGTPHYMSPEQAMGERSLDARSDVYALGCMLYEMLAGEPPFTGPTAQAIVAKVLTATPAQVTTLRKTVPPHVAAAVHIALEKLPADRFATATEFAEALANPAITAASRAAGLVGPPRRRGLVTIPLAALSVLFALIALWALLRPAPPTPVIRYALALPPSQSPDPTRYAIPSPDGARIVYVGVSEGASVSQLWIKERDRHAATPMPGTIGVNFFTFSPDGNWVAYIGGGDLKKFPIAGGTGIPIVASGVATRPAIAWLDDGTIVYATSGAREIARVSDRGGTPPTVIWSSDSMTVEQLSPLPDARGVLFQACETPCNETDVLALDLESGATHRVVPGARSAFYLPTGHLAYVRPDGAMLVVPFDLGSLEVGGDPVPVIDSIAIVGTSPLVAISSSGTLVMRTGAALDFQEFELVWMDQSGRVTVVDSTDEPFRLIAFAGNHGWALSPDGTQLAIGIATASGDDIWWKRLPRGPLSRVSYDAGAEYRPRWMPDGQSIVFNSARSEPGFYSRRADGSGTDSLLVEGVYDEGAVSPNGQWYLFRGGATSAAAGGRDILAMRVGVDSAPVPLLATPYDEEAFALSPDGRFMAYQSDETGRNEIFIRPFPEVETEKRQASDGGGGSPVWSRDGRELYYLSRANDMMAVTVTAGPTMQVGEPRVLFRLPADIALASAEYYTPWDIAPDGRFIMVRSLEAPSQLEAPLIVVENFFEELKAKVGN